MVKKKYIGMILVVPALIMLVSVMLFTLKEMDWGGIIILAAVLMAWVGVCLMD